MTTALYLALHYTGQVWGMMSSYAFMHGIRFSDGEKRTLRACLRTLALWQMGWALTSSPSYIPSFAVAAAPTCMKALHLAATISLCVGITTLVGLSRRLSIRLPTSIILPYASIHVWYLFLYVFPQSIFWVQLFHALQYLSFPARVEMNRAAETHHFKERAEARHHLLRYCGALIVASFVVFVGINKGLNYPNGGFEAHWLVICSMINIHHYFIDGCIWHISNPKVKSQLFSHLQN